MQDGRDAKKPREFKRKAARESVNGVREKLKTQQFGRIIVTIFEVSRKGEACQGPQCVTTTSKLMAETGPVAQPLADDVTAEELAARLSRRRS
jgi:hypothetical protein